jgi:hypothetical protein
MSDDVAADQTVSAETDAPVEQQQNELPPDHPLVKTLAVQKAAIKELKAKAARLDAIEESQKSESERMADKIAKAEAEAATVPARVADALRAHLIQLHAIDEQDAELFLTAQDPELLLKQIDRLVARTGNTTKGAGASNGALHIPTEGRNPTPPALNSDDLERAVRAAVGNPRN